MALSLVSTCFKLSFFTYLILAQVVVVPFEEAQTDENEYSRARLGKQLEKAFQAVGMATDGLLSPSAFTWKNKDKENDREKA